MRQEETNVGAEKKEEPKSLQAVFQDVYHISLNKPTDWLHLVAVARANDDTVPLPLFYPLSEGEKMLLEATGKLWGFPKDPRLISFVAPLEAPECFPYPPKKGSTGELFARALSAPEAAAQLAEALGQQDVPADQSKELIQQCQQSSASAQYVLVFEANTVPKSYLKTDTENEPDKVQFWTQVMEEELDEAGKSGKTFRLDWNAVRYGINKGSLSYQILSQEEAEELYAVWQRNCDTEARTRIKDALQSLCRDREDLKGAVWKWIEKAQLLGLL